MSTQGHLRDDHGAPDRTRAEERRAHRLMVEFYGALTVYHASSGPPENPPSLATCERSHISGAVGRFEGELRAPSERQALQAALKLGVDDVDRAARVAAGGGDRLTALWAALEREPDRQEKVVALLERDEVSHALRLATCGRRSVQLECPELGGGCGHDQNYVPISCDSRLCPDCAKRRTGQNIERYAGPVSGMEHPTFLTATIPNVSDPTEGRERCMEAFARLRRRTVPTEGEVRREAGEGGERVTKRWCWSAGGEGAPADPWKSHLLEAGEHELARSLERRYVHAEWTDVTGTHRGKNIPVSELLRGGIYAIDVKQVGREEFNVHLHALVDMAYIPQAALASVWEDITGAPVLDVRRVYGRGGEDIQEAVAETVGYATKAPEFESVESAVEFATETAGAPLVHPFGTVHGAGERVEGYLRCARCEVAPAWWNYEGVVSDRIDNMGTGNGPDGDRPPPAEER
jgi:hypothetical protein